MSVSAWQELELRVGRVVRAEVNDRARRPAYKLWIDFGDQGILTSSAQIVTHYRPEDLLERFVIAAVNLGQRDIAGFTSQVLVLGAPDSDGAVVLLQPERPVPLGARVC